MNAEFAKSSLRTLRVFPLRPLRFKKHSPNDNLREIHDFEFAKNCCHTLLFSAADLRCSWAFVIVPGLAKLHLAEETQR